MRGAVPEFLEGASQASRIAIVAFDSVQAARDFYHSAAYQAAREKRLPAAEFRMTLLEGAPERRDVPLQRVSRMKSVPLPVS